MLDPDIERIAYINNNQPLVRIFIDAEEEIEDLKMNLEYMTDDRNALRDALQACFDQMEELQTDCKNFYNEETIRRVFGPLVEDIDKVIDEQLQSEPETDVSEEFKDALEQATQALSDAAPQEEPTAKEEVAALRQKLEETRNALDVCRESQRDHLKLLSLVRGVLRPYRAKAGPAWAEELKRGFSWHL